MFSTSDLSEPGLVSANDVTITIIVVVDAYCCDQWHKFPAVCGLLKIFDQMKLIYINYLQYHVKLNIPFKKNCKFYFYVNNALSYTKIFGE